MLGLVEILYVLIAKWTTNVQCHSLWTHLNEDKSFHWNSKLLENYPPDDIISWNIRIRILNKMVVKTPQNVFTMCNFISTQVYILYIYRYTCVGSNWGSNSAFHTAAVKKTHKHFSRFWKFWKDDLKLCIFTVCLHGKIKGNQKMPQVCTTDLTS